MVTRCIREAVALAWVVLWVLSTRVGTLLLCGRLCLAGGGFPYVRKFADMPPERREAALQRWNRVRWLFPLRIAFAARSSATTSSTPWYLAMDVFVFQVS